MKAGAMNADRLLKHYERIADAPDAIARLRRFILDLAVRGKLVPQDPKDEPASELLKRIAAEKARLVKAGETKAAKAIPEIAETPFPIPPNWRWSQLAEIGVLSPRNEAPDTLRASFVPMPMIAAEYGVGNQHEVRPWGDIKKGYTHFSEGDVGLAKITPCFENGKSTVFRNLTGWIGSGTTELHIVRPLFVDQDYILLFLKSPHFIETGIPKMTGTAGQKRVPAEYFAHSPFPLPPLAEQRRIVAKLDELMALCDQLEVARGAREAARDRLAAASLARLNNPDPGTGADPEKTEAGPASNENFQADARFALNGLPALTTRPDQIKQLRQTILNLAVRGKLVPQDPKDEPAAELLKRIAKEKARCVSQGTLRDQKPVPPIEGSEIEFELALGWQWVRMAEVIKLWNGFAFKSGDFQSTGVPVVRIGDLQDGVVTLSGATCVAEPVAKTVGPEVWIPPDALLIAMSGATTGKTAFNRTGIPLLLNQRVGRIEVFSISVNFLRFFFETIVARNLRISFGTAIPNLSAQQINETVIPLPPLAEQHRIVAKVDELMALCDHLEASLKDGEATRSRLLDALLHEAREPASRELEAAE